MKISSLMRRDIKTVTPEATIETATLLMREFKCRHLPVVDSSNLLVGIVSMADVGIRQALFTESPCGDYQCAIVPDAILVKHIMSTDVITVASDADVVSAIHLMHRKKIHCLPVVKGEKAVGIVEDTDLLELLERILSAFGVIF